MALRFQTLLVAIAIAASTLISACRPDDNDTETPEIEWEGEWLRFGRSASLPPQCEGVAPYMDRYVGALVDIFDVEPQGPVDFFYVDQLSSPCEALGCARGHRVFSLESVQEHELVHAVRSFSGNSHRLLEEGAAELWGDDSKKYDFREMTAGDLVSIAKSSTSSGPASDAYGLAGRFHALLALDASNPTASLLRSTAPGMNGDELSMHLADETGLTLQDWGSELDQYPACAHRQFRDPSAACASVTTVPRCLNGEEAIIEAYVGCEDTETLGPRDGEIWKYLAVDIDVPGTYGFYVDFDLDDPVGTVELKQCTAGCSSVFETKNVPSTVVPSAPFEAEAGRYLLRFTLPEGESRLFRVQLTGNCD